MDGRFLDFDISEDADGNVTFDAMATVPARLWPQLLAEVGEVLRWAEHGFGGRQGPLDEGGDWDYELQGTQEAVTPLAFSVPSADAPVGAQPRGEPTWRYTLSLTVTGSPAFADAWRRR